MEGVSSASLFKGHWRKKVTGYERINGSSSTRKMRVVELADGTTKRRRFWRINKKLKLRFSPKKFLTRLRDGYINMMLKIANSRMVGGGGGFSGGGFGGGGGGGGFGVRPIKEYDQRMIVEIYKSIVLAQGQVVPRDAAWINSGITCQQR